MNTLQNISPKLVMRLGLAFCFAYAGISALVNPEAWIGFVPDWLAAVISKEIFLLVHGVFEIILAAAIAFNVFPKISYAIAGLALLSLVVFYGIDDVTFRDVGLLALSGGLWLDSMRRSTLSSAQL